MIPRYVVLANPDSKRWLAYEPELRGFWRARNVSVEVELVPWNLVVPRRGNLDGLSAFDQPAIVRMESPGRDWDVTRQLLALGAGEQGRTDAASYLSLPYQKGKLVEPLLFYEGFRRTLVGLDAAFQERPHLHVLSDPLEVAEMFDKNATCVRLARAGIPIPETVTGADYPTPPWPTTYVKLNTGSSASAIVVLTQRPGEMLRGESTVVRLADGFYSSRRLANYSGEALDTVLGFLRQQGQCVQQGIRMATLDGQNFDIRVVCIHGKPSVTIFRLSWLPMTNLHLGGKRGDWAECRRAIPTRAWLDALDHCEEAARLYRAEVVGIDLLFEAGFQRHFLLEVNAFGDFFPGLTGSDGQSIPMLEIAETARRLGWIS